MVINTVRNSCKSPEGSDYTEPQLHSWPMEGQTGNGEIIDRVKYKEIPTIRSKYNTRTSQWPVFLYSSSLQ